jgi:nicotinate-nucleotide--dimethylbenzimidazole phosphoribosyltransferase
MIEATIAAIRPLDEAAMQAARNRQDILTKPTRALGRLEDLSVQLAGITRRCPPPVPARKAVLVFAGDHGVTAQGVSAYPKEVTGQMVLNFLGGGAAINVLARQAGARVVVVDAGVATELPAAAGLIHGKIARGTADMSAGPAMTREQAVAALELGARVAQAEIDDGLDLLACGEMGIGNTTAASAIVATITGAAPDVVTGPGTGIDADSIRRKAAIIEKALRVNAPDPADGLDTLAKVGGFEIGAIAGAMLAAAANGVPIVVDGFISGSAALIAATLCATAKQYMIGGHQSTEPGHVAAMTYLGLTPLLDMRMRLGEGTGAVLAMHLVDASARILGEMATFESAGVSNR